MTRRIPRPAARQRGAAALIAMMFLVIFSSLAAAMAIVSQGNLHTASAQLKVSRSLASAETGMGLMRYQLARAARQVKTKVGAIEPGNDEDQAGGLWQQTVQQLIANMTGNLNSQGNDPYESGGVLHVGPAYIAADCPPFTATLQPHPLPDEDYDSDYYQRPPYDGFSPAVSNEHPLDGRYIRVTVTAAEGKPGDQVARTIKMDFKLDKKIRFALLSKSRVMIGRNVLIDGPVGSTFTETNLTNGHPVQMESDFHGLSDDLDDKLDALVGSLIGDEDHGDRDGDNRLRLGDPFETGNIPNAQALDRNGDGYIDDYDMFLDTFAGSDPARVTQTDLQSGGLDAIHAKQLVSLIDTFNPDRNGDGVVDDADKQLGYDDGIIDNQDRYAKLHGELYIKADHQGWQDGAADGAYQDFLQGPVVPEHGESAVTFEADQAAQQQFTADDFDVQSFENETSDNFYQQVTSQAGAEGGDSSDPDAPRYDNRGKQEAVPFGSAYPYDYYERPVFENMTFRNVKIPKGTNALFKNCKFIGVTFVDTETDNADPNYSYSGMQYADLDPKHPDRTADVNGSAVENTKTLSNNIRFDSCSFEGPVVSAAPKAFTQTRNKLAFTGDTDFDIAGSSELTPAQKQRYQRSTILAPNMSIEMGTFVSPADSSETIRLSGTIVAGLIDMRGKVDVNGTILTTFEPKSNEGPVLGETSPQFNTTLGYFSAAQGDLEAEIPGSGLGVIHLRYDPNLALPDGINGPIEIRALPATYFEGR